MSEKSLKAARDFIEKEKQFHLGFLPTEQSSPLTRDLDRRFAGSSTDGVRCLQRVDRNVLDMARRVLASPEFSSLVEKALFTLQNGGRVVFSGCGATGRLSILLECMWREACEQYGALKKWSNSVFSIMTGGDYALVRSVEFFEDYQSFGRRQVADLDLRKGDMLVAITEGGETSSVLGTVFESLDRWMSVYLLFNNPANVLAEHLERSRVAIEDPRVTVLDLSCGPMALAGSTRMQATTSEQLIAGAALESVACRLCGIPAPDYANGFAVLLDELENAAGDIAKFIDFEAGIYRAGGRLTYFADAYMLDIFTDTTERTPTFMLPPFLKCDDKKSSPPWTMVKNPLCLTREVWRRQMRRDLRCLNWTIADYEKLGASDSLKTHPPMISAEEILKFEVGCEPSVERHTTGSDAAVLAVFGDAAAQPELTAKFRAQSGEYKYSRVLTIGGSDGDFSVALTTVDSPLSLMRHMAVKLVFNTLSTGVMVVLGRVTGNWMSFVDATNKKLIDRATRLIVEIGKLSYDEACARLFEAIEEQAALVGEKPSLVQQVLKNLK